MWIAKIYDRRSRKNYTAIGITKKEALELVEKKYLEAKNKNGEVVENDNATAFYKFVKDDKMTFRKLAKLLFWNNKH